MKQTAPIFTPTEIELGCNLAPKTVEMLKREGFAPNAIEKAARGRTAKYDFTGFCRFATIAAVSLATGKLFQAARIANTMCSELELTYGEFPTGLKCLGRDYRDSVVRFENREIDNVNTFHNLWKNHYSETANSLDSDFIIVIADGEYVFQKIFSGIKFSDTNSNYSPLFRLLLQGKSHSYRIERPEEDHSENNLYMRRLQSSVVKIELNLSLNIRRSIFNILEARLDYNSPEN